MKQSGVIAWFVRNPVAANILMFVILISAQTLLGIQQTFLFGNLFLFAGQLSIDILDQRTLFLLHKCGWKRTVFRSVRDIGLRKTKSRG